jgi:hypothetical protein
VLVYICGLSVSLIVMIASAVMINGYKIIPVASSPSVRIVSIVLYSFGVTGLVYRNLSNGGPISYLCF